MRAPGVNHVALEVDSEGPAGRLAALPRPWGNNIEVVDYRDVQFTKAPAVLHGMSLQDLNRSDEALQGPRRKGLAG